MHQIYSSIEFVFVFFCEVISDAKVIPGITFYDIN